MLAIVDYQMGNLRSVQKAFERTGHAAHVTSQAEQIASAERLVLPGVGAFADAMRELESRGLVDPIRDFIRSGRPFLGICLGLQLLFDESSEGGIHRGLGVLPGRVRRFELARPFKVPHMGWNSLQERRPNPLWQGMKPSSYVYFVHSYFVEPADPSDISLEATYGHAFCAMVRRENVFATQFHPEKSQSVGLRMIANFAEL